MILSALFWYVVPAILLFVYTDLGIIECLLLPIVFCLLMEILAEQVENLIKKIRSFF